MNGPQHRPARHRNRLLFLVGAIGGLLLGSYVYYANQSDSANESDPDQTNGVDNDSGRLDPAAFAQMQRETHLATGHLENMDLDAADALYAELTRLLPDEPLPIRNLTIARYLAFEAGKSEREPVEEALGQLQRVEPEAASTSWLEARIALKASESLLGVDPEGSAAMLSRATDALRAAERQDPSFAGAPYELFEALRFAESPADRERGQAALGRAYDRAPDNLFVLGEWLLVQIDQHDPAVVETLQRSKETVAPLHKQILDNVRVDVFAMIDEALAAVGEENWNLAKARVRAVFVNSIRSHEFAQNDLRRLKPHALEFALHEYSPAFRVHYDKPPYQPSLPPGIDVSLPAVDGDGQFPALADVQDLLAVDFTLNGTQDLVVLRPTSVEVYGQDTAAGGWKQVAAVEVPQGMRGVMAADLDHDRDHAIAHETLPDGTAGPQKSEVCFDADVDLVVYGEPGLLVLRNDLNEDQQQRSLVPVGQSGDLQIPPAHRGVLVDFDHDSNLDIVLATDSGLKMLLAAGNLTFFDATSYSHVPPSEHPFTDLVAVDWDRDADIDVLATAPEGNLVGYLDNKRHGNFRWVPLGAPFEKLAGSTELALVDCDGNASWDLIGSGAGGLQVVRTHASPDGAPLATGTAQAGAAPLGGHLLWDYDNDGWQDVLAWGERSTAVFRGAPGGRFAVAAELQAEFPAAIRKCDVADFDGDGDQDVAILTADTVILYTNEGGNQNHWLDIRTLGRVDNKGKANHNGIGGLVEIKAGPHYQAQVVARPVTHFGLGSLERADIIRYLWPNGVPQARLEPTTSQAICETMVLKGSCPYLYTWTGERFEFFTDLLWAAPIGLQFAEGVLAPAREWEHLLIPGDRLRPRNGQYALQVTEELWEAAYFDSVELFAVDHPADVEVYTNEKVGPASIAAPQIHTVRRRRRPLAARDKHGRDVLDVVAQRDGEYLRGFDRHHVPGLVDAHYLELDLGDLPNVEQIKLFLTGWIYPTDTSLNVALSRHPDLAGPKPPAILVPDADGRWQETIPYMGFPGGKPKTIVVDLSQAFLTDDYRLRIVTTAEIYWDEVFFTVGDQPAEIRQTRLTLTAADLHNRGFSQALPPRENWPELYDYELVSRLPKWPPMNGRFTRFGDVRELLLAEDDRLVVLGAGDEMTLTFAAPATKLPPGWTRDFVIRNVGWDKDADLNTVYGQTVEPLPFVGMERYPFPVDQRPPQGPEYDRYLQEYQTRTQQRAGFWYGIRDFGTTPQ